MNKPTLNQIKNVMLSLNMKVFTKPFDVTLGAIRTNDNASGSFNDFVFAMYHDDLGVLKGEVVEGTTDAGVYYRTSPMNKNGTAIIQHSKQFAGVYEYQNPKANNPTLKKEGKPLELGHNGEEAFRQIKAIDYWRDNDKNAVLGKAAGKPDFELLPTETSISATNGHNMGEVGKDVGKWSAGCWGATKNKMRKLYDIAKLQIKAGLGKRFSFAMLHENDFINYKAKN